jgi:hypothetical protein
MTRRAGVVRGERLSRLHESYASLTDLPWRFPIFDALVKALDAHVAAFAEDLEFDLGGPQAGAGGHLDQHPARGRHPHQPHPPPFGDLRHDLCAGPAGGQVDQAGGPAPRDDDGRPARKKDAREELRAFVYPGPLWEVGDVLLWESWLRHEVPMNMDEDDRVSVSFNYPDGKGRPRDVERKKGDERQRTS